ncbi:MAG: ABC transporter permease [Phycisphaerae bacterium]
MGLRNLLLHKLRSLLTALGIIFGVAAVIVMVAIGQGTKLAAEQQMEALGASNVLVRSVPPPEARQAGGANQRTLSYGIKRADVALLKDQPGFKFVVPLRDTEQTVAAAGRPVSANAIATTPDIFPVVNLRLQRGETFNQEQYERAEPVAVLGAAAAKELFPYDDPIGKTVQVGQPSSALVVLRVVGVLEPAGLRSGNEASKFIDRDIEQDIYFPLTLSDRNFYDLIVKRRSGSMERKEIEISEVWLQTHSKDTVEAMANVIRAAGPFSGLPLGERPDVVVKAPIEILRAAERQEKMFNFIMVGIASFSLVVGGIGIMNIMLATVTERTKEIGIRRALGAKRRHITLQFLIETTAISLSGGLLGITLGAGGAYLLPVIADFFGGTDYPTSVTASSVAASFVVSGLIGIGFGLYPAIKAAHMNPIEALRHE